MTQTDSLTGFFTQDAWPSWFALALPVVGIAVGAVLLLMGGRLLRPGLVILGAFAGIGGGIVLSRSFAGERLFDVPLEILLPVGGGLVGGAVALALYRFAMAVGAAVSFAGLGALVTIVVLAVTGGDLPPVPETPSPVRMLASPAGLAEAKRLVGVETNAGVFAAGARTTAESYWSEIPSASRPGLALGVIGGAVLGLLCGAAFPRFTGAVVTGLGGSAGVLGCGGFLLARVEPSIVDNLSPLAMLAGWALLGAIGAGIQLTPGRKQAAAAAAA